MLVKDDHIFFNIDFGHVWNQGLLINAPKISIPMWIKAHLMRVNCLRLLVTILHQKGSSWWIILSTTTLSQLIVNLILLSGGMVNYVGISTGITYGTISYANQ
jgi:hypothetical protein